MRYSRAAEFVFTNEQNGLLWTLCSGSPAIRFPCTVEDRQIIKLRCILNVYLRMVFLRIVADKIPSWLSSNGTKCSLWFGNDAFIFFITAVGEMKSLSAAFVKLPQSDTAKNVSSNWLYLTLLCKLLIYAMITYRLFRVNAFRVYNKGMKDGFNMSKALIAFYSRADENYVNGTLKMLTIGNTDVLS